jgi:hypothetical protein
VTALAHEIDEVETPTLLHREFAAQVTPGDGRTVDVLIVPYDEQIEHNDGFGGVPKGVVYREQWTPGVFAHQDGAANRVLANVEHEEGIRGVVGHGLELLERSDGFYGSFKIHDTPDGDKALLLIKEGVFSGVSVEARPRKSQRTVDGLVRRVKADLVNIAFTRIGAYKRAGVLAVREEADNEITMVDEALQPVEMKPELLERCRALGVELPQRYQAHPEPTDTPDSSGTSDAGTRQSESTQDKTEESP